MKSASSIFVFALLPLLCTDNTLSAQSAAPVDNSHIFTVSERIADRYHADERVVQSFVEAAVDLESRGGIPAAVTIAIAIHESGFTSQLFAESGNPFGIKASSPWNGPTVSRWHDGAETPFRVYDSPEEAVQGFNDFIKSRSWYADALSCSPDDYYCVLEGLKQTAGERGYSLNPDWDEAVLSLIQKMELQTLAVR